jgi:hypothetical protein
MECRKAQEMLSAYHDGELPEGDRARVSEHLETCPECAAHLESMARADAAAAVPDPGPEYWERFNRRVTDRIARERDAPKGTIAPHPKRGWVRQQLRYLVPAAAAAVLAVVIFRNIGPGPGAPVRTEAPPTMETTRVPPPAAAPVPPAARDEQTGPAPAEYPRRAEGKAVADRERRSRMIREAPARSGRAEEKAAPPPAPAAGSVPGGKDANLAAPERIVAAEQASGEAPPRKPQAAGAAAPMTAGAGQLEMSAKAIAERKDTLPPVGCEEARALATQGRLKEAESAQRGCLARDDSPAVQESGLIFLTELLDRQHRFAEADNVIGETQRRFPGSRPLERYRQIRSQVQGGGLPAGQDRIR